MKANKIIHSKLSRQFSCLAIAIVTVVAFQNCGSNFQILDAASMNSASTAAGAPGGPGVPTAPPDYNSDVLTKMGITFGPKGNSTCQMQPPIIPAFDVKDEGPMVLKVCPEAECKYHKIADALAAATAGATIAVKAATYNECILVSTDNIILQGRGGRPNITTLSCAISYNNGIIGVNADHFRLENFEISGSNPDPAAEVMGGLIVFRPTANLTVINTYFHNLGGGVYTVGIQDVVFTNTYFSNTGHQVGTDAHTSYALNIGIGTKSFTMTNSIIAHPRQNGGMLGATADKNLVNCVVAADMNDGVSPHLIRFGWGMDSTITNSVLQKSENGVPQMLLFWERSAPLPADQFTMKNNIFISDRAMRDRDIAECWATVPQSYSNNTFVGPSSAPYAVNFTDSHVFDSRAAAGLGATNLPYPGTTLPMK